MLSLTLLVYIAGSVIAPAQAASDNGQSVQIILSEIMYHPYSEDIQAEDMGAYTVELHSAEFRENAHSFYESLGFEHKGSVFSIRT